MTFGSPSVEQMPQSPQPERVSSPRLSPRPDREVVFPYRLDEERGTRRSASSPVEQHSKQRQPLSAPVIHKPDPNSYRISTRDDQIRAELHEYFKRVEKGYVWADHRGFINVSDVLAGSWLSHVGVNFTELIAFVKGPAGKSFKIQPTAFANEFSYSPADFEIKLADESDNTDLDRSQSAPGGSS
ncbi:hypothetical protein CB0940_12172 [Cercospora beticola]|nr:hypothetical protein CB0940_12172 [Cercospora beticola]PIA81341.1 hypothetical protein CB0940_12172 [Cercospora beticola]